MKIKKTATETLCNEIAEMYWSKGHLEAMKEFQKWCDTQKLAKWEYIVIVERIKELILVKKGSFLLSR